MAATGRFLPVAANSSDVLFSHAHDSEVCWSKPMYSEVICIANDWSDRIETSPIEVQFRTYTFPQSNDFILLSNDH
ncbi:hypothetical protein D3C84_764380 [compost metagenome]|jgi:hypothetical protein